MIPVPRIYVSLKFRAFFVTFANFEKLVTLDISSGFKFVVTDAHLSDVPDDAKTILNRNGLLLKGWLG